MVAALALELLGCAAAQSRASTGDEVSSSEDDDDGSTASTTSTGSASSGSDDDSSETSGSGSTSSSGADDSSGGSETGETPTGWMLEYHSCPGPSRTDALLIEADGAWVGCGSNAVGYGLHARGGDGTWAEVVAEPAGELDAFRVSAIARGDDGLLYIAGFDASDSDMVLSVDTEASPNAVEEVLVAGNIVGTSFHVGSLAVLDDGRIVAESLTGLGMLVRPDENTGSNATTWIDAYYWANGGSPPGYQMQDLFTRGDGLYGSGATIAEPPYLYLPPRDAAAEPWELEVLQLPNEGWTGEMWGVAATPERVVVVGVDQDGDVGKIFVSGSDPYDGLGYTTTDLTAIGGDGNVGTWARGVCMRGDQIVVVGERQPLSDGTGLVLRSTDGGATFEDLTPEDVTESVSKCFIAPNGSVIVAGAGGFVGRYD
ncbi:MAG TPA: hypothetical protein VG755_35765 [Nannocystaceae bacterium]|nr:hypothetical protein [Nannocystaceae bacterium]